MRFVLAAVGLLLLHQELPPPFPRAGTTKLFENDRVVVWDIAWLRQVYPLHRHPYDMTGVYYQSGDRIIISPEGERRQTSTQAWNITFQRAGLTHSEEGASDVPLRSVFIEMKQPSDGPAAATDGQVEFPVGSPAQRLDNDRVTVWEYGAPAAESRRAHRHPREAVVVSFDAAGGRHVRYVDRGTVHDTDVEPGTTRTFVFEIK
jgi:hypothetical protein